MRTLNYKELGSGDHTIVIVHGLFGSLDNWQTIGKQFSEKYRVILVDQRNHGKSPHFDLHNYESMSADLDNLLDNLQISKCILLGHSMGGKTVMRYAVDHPDRVEKLIVADISPKQYPVHHQLILQALNSVDFTEDNSRQLISEKISQSIKSPGVIQFLMKGVARDDDNNFTWKFNLPVLTQQIENIGEPLNEFDNYDGPTLFLAGEKSDYIQIDDEIIIKRNFPKASIVKIKNAGHWLHAENPKDFYNEVVSFIDNK